MRRFALGVLHYTPRRFGKMLVGDFLSAMEGYHEAENERVKTLAQIVRTATWFLWNTQVINEDRKDLPSELWPFEWDLKQTDGKEVTFLPDDKISEIENIHVTFLNKKS